MRQDIQSIEFHCPRSDEIQCARGCEISHQVTGRAVPTSPIQHLGSGVLVLDVHTLNPEEPDKSQLRKGNARQAMAILRNIDITLLKHRGQHNLARSSRKLRNQTQTVLAMIGLMPVH